MTVHCWYLWCVMPNMILPVLSSPMIMRHVEYYANWNFLAFYDNWNQKETIEWPLVDSRIHWLTYCLLNASIVDPCVNCRYHGHHVCNYLINWNRWIYPNLNLALHHVAALSLRNVMHSNYIDRSIDQFESMLNLIYLERVGNSDVIYFYRKM